MTCFKFFFVLTVSKWLTRLSMVYQLNLEKQKQIKLRMTALTNLSNQILPCDLFCVLCDDQIYEQTETQMHLLISTSNSFCLALYTTYVVYYTTNVNSLEIPILF